MSFSKRKISPQIIEKKNGENNGNIEENTDTGKLKIEITKTLKREDFVFKPEWKYLGLKDQQLMSDFYTDLDKIRNPRKSHQAYYLT